MTLSKQVTFCIGRHEFRVHMPKQTIILTLTDLSNISLPHYAPPQLADQLFSSPHQGGLYTESEPSSPKAM